MRHLPADKYNVAWFKLAEFVSRGEKERALSLYRLLVHSFDDKALANQLEGDILLSFNDYNALDRYFLAAQEYEKSKRLIEASAVYEHIILLRPDSEEALRKLVELYGILKNKARLAEIMPLLCGFFIAHNRFEDINEILHHSKKILNPEQLMPTYEKIVLEGHQRAPADLLQLSLKNTLDALISCQSPILLNQFLEKIKVVHDDLYLQAFFYLEEKKK